MNSRPYMVLALVLVVGLAGCSGFSPLEEDTPSTETTTQPGTDDSQHKTDTKTTTRQSETDDSRDKTSTKIDIAYPAGYTQSGINPQKAVAQHNSALFEQNSFTGILEYNGTGSVNAGEILGYNNTSSINDTRFNYSMVVTARVNITNKRMHRTTIRSTFGHLFHDTEVYASESRVYGLNNSTSSNTTYRSTTQPFNRSLQASEFGDSALAWFEGADFGSAETVTRDGQRLLQYEATRVTNATPFLLGGSTTNPRVNDFNATILVDQNGIIRSFTYSMTYTANGKTQEITANYRTIELDTTTVTKPDWVKKAKSQSS